MAGSVPIVSSAVAAAPKDYTVPQAQEIIPLAVTAAMDGTGAASTFFPALQLLAPDGTVMWTAIGQAVAAGASADVSWFPGLGGGNTVINNFTPGAILDYAEPPAGTLNITATSATAAQQWIVGNPITLDGLSRIRVECFIALATTNHDVIAELYDNGADVSRLIQIGYLPPQNLTNIALSVFGAANFVPTAGVHNFEVRAWTDTGATSSFLNPTPFPFVTFAPSYYQVTVVPLVP